MFFYFFLYFPLLIFYASPWQWGLRGYLLLAKVEYFYFTKIVKLFYISKKVKHFNTTVFYSRITSCHNSVAGSGFAPQTQTYSIISR